MAPECGGVTWAPWLPLHRAWGRESAARPCTLAGQEPAENNIIVHRTGSRTKRQTDQAKPFHDTAQHPADQCSRPDRVRREPRPRRGRGQSGSPEGARPTARLPATEQTRVRFIRVKFCQMGTRYGDMRPRHDGDGDANPSPPQLPRRVGLPGFLVPSGRKKANRKRKRRRAAARPLRRTASG